MAGRGAGRWPPGRSSRPDGAAAAEVTFTDASRLELGENTLVVILGHAQAERLPGVLPETTLVTGALRANLGALAGESPATAKVRTDAAEVALGSGESKLSVDQAKTTRLAVYRGRSSVRAAKKTVEVPEGFGSGVKKGEAPSPPRRLPAAPVWAEAPPPTIEAPAAALLKARYQGGPDGATPATFHVQLARDDRFGELVVDARVGAEITALEARELGGGVYFARVSAIDADEFEGPFGPTARTEVTIKVPPPPPPAPVVVVAPPPPPKRPLRLRPGVSVLAGTGFVSTNQRWGPRLAVEVAGGVELRPRLTLSLALRGQWEHLDGAATDDEFLGVTRRALGGGLLASASYQLPRARGLTPYLGVLAEVNTIEVRYSSGEASSDWFNSWGPVLGAALPLGPGGLVVEGLWRAPTSYANRQPRNAPISTLGLLAGYRLWF